MGLIRFAPALLLVVGLLYPVSAAAQAVGTGTIAGTVRDATGLLRGVTVEAISPALIEGSRSVTTDEAGRYSIVNLRPGTYTVTFTLVGFSTVKREGIELTSDFTATVNSQLTVGAVAETVTVQSRSPVVDVQSVGQAKVYTRDVLDALPTDRTPNAVLFTIPGTQAGSFGLFSFRGSADSLTLVDGMRMTYLVGAGPGSTSAPTNSNMYQEFSFSNNIDSAEYGQPGLRTNLVLRDGGNQFHATVFAEYHAGRVAVGTISTTRCAPRMSRLQRRHRNSGISTRVAVVRFDAIRCGMSRIRTSGRIRCRPGRSTMRTRCRTATLRIRVGPASPRFAAPASHRG